MFYDVLAPECLRTNDEFCREMADFEIKDFRNWARLSGVG
jgi:hypothetical protein